MNSLFLLLLESSLLISLTGLLITLFCLRRAPVGFQHYNLFYYGVPPDGLVPVESAESAAIRPANWH